MNRTPATASSGKVILDAAGITAKVRELQAAITKEFGRDTASVAIVGIQTRGAVLARRVAAALEQQTGQAPSVGILDITLYRDDVHAIADQPEVKETDLPFEIDNRPIVLVDDVLFTGRTVRSAMNALIDYGRPRCIRLGVLVDRGHRELPIGADYVGLVLKTNPEDVVDVNLMEIDEEDCIRLRRRKKE